MTINVNVKCTNGEKFAVAAEPTQVVSDFKALVATQSSVPADQQRLIYKGHVLQDARTLDSYSVQDGQTVILVRGARPRTDQPAASSAASTPAAPVTAANSVPAASNTGVPAANPFASLMGGGFGGGMDLGRIQQELFANPEQMQAVMNSPLMQSLMDNPEVLSSMFQNNPQFREIIDQNPELAHVLNDPAIIRQSFQMAQNPNLMREMMRNTDRAMSNIEAHPEGFNALRRMYETIQEPMMEAAVDATTANRGTSSQSSRPSDPPSQAQLPSSPSGAPLPNPWASNTRAPAANQQQSAPSINPFMGMFGQIPAQSQNSSGAGASSTGAASSPFAQFGGMSPEAISQLMQNPIVQQSMQQMMSDPAQMQAMINMNPQLRQMIDANPQMQAAFSNPALMQAMFNPQVVQAAMQMMSAHPPNPTNPSAATGAQPNPFANLSALLAAQGASGAFPPAPAPAASNIQPEILYRQQLSQLNDMGFTNASANLSALMATGGNVQAAIERLLQ